MKSTRLSKDPSMADLEDIWQSASATTCCTVPTQFIHTAVIGIVQ
jgi:hypothetical protein